VQLARQPVALLKCGHGLGLEIQPIGLFFEAHAVHSGGDQLADADRQPLFAIGEGTRGVALEAQQAHEPPVQAKRDRDQRVVAFAFGRGGGHFVDRRAIRGVFDHDQVGAFVIAHHRDAVHRQPRAKLPGAVLRFGDQLHVACYREIVALPHPQHDGQLVHVELFQRVCNGLVRPRGVDPGAGAIEQLALVARLFGSQIGAAAGDDRGQRLQERGVGGALVAREDVRLVPFDGDQALPLPVTEQRNQRDGANAKLLAKAVGLLVHARVGLEVFDEHDLVRLRRPKPRHPIILHAKRPVHARIVRADPAILPDSHDRVGDCQTAVAAVDVAQGERVGVVLVRVERQRRENAAFVGGLRQGGVDRQQLLGAGGTLAADRVQAHRVDDRPGLLDDRGEDAQIVFVEVERHRPVEDQAADPAPLDVERQQRHAANAQRGEQGARVARHEIAVQRVRDQQRALGLRHPRPRISVMLVQLEALAGRAVRGALAHPDGGTFGERGPAILVVLDVHQHARGRAVVARVVTHRLQPLSGSRGLSELVGDGIEDAGFVRPCPAIQHGAPTGPRPIRSARRRAPLVSGWLRSACSGCCSRES